MRRFKGFWRTEVPRDRAPGGKRGSKVLTEVWGTVFRSYRVLLIRKTATALSSVTEIKQESCAIAKMTARCALYK